MFNLLSLGIVLFGLADQPIQRSWLDYDRLAAEPKARVTFDTSPNDLKFLGAGARFTTTVSSWQMWLLLHPEAKKVTEIPVDEASHRNVAARLSVRYLERGAVVKEDVLDARTEGKFTQALDCTEKIFCYIPANVPKTTPSTEIPALADEMVIELRALELSTGTVSPLVTSLSRKLTLQGNPVHLYTKIHDFKPLWRVVDADGLYRDRATEVLYSPERAMSYLSWIEKDLLERVNQIELCRDKTKTQLKTPLHADVNMVQLHTTMQYRFDGGDWSAEIPAQAFADLKGVVTPSVWDSPTGFALPAGGRDARKAELRFRIRGIVDVDRSMCESYRIAFGDKIVVNYPKGHKIDVGTVIDPGNAFDLK